VGNCPGGEFPLEGEGVVRLPNRACNRAIVLYRRRPGRAEPGSCSSSSDLPHCWRDNRSIDSSGHPSDRLYTSLHSSASAVAAAAAAAASHLHISAPFCSAGQLSYCVGHGTQRGALNPEMTCSVTDMRPPRTSTHRPRDHSWAGIHSWDYSWCDDQSVFRNVRGLRLHAFVHADTWLIGYAGARSFYSEIVWLGTNSTKNYTLVTIVCRQRYHLANCLNTKM